ncbi:MAG: hypothetical protein JKY70_15855 [Mucilaginibacter sp.]|nr:hypothetical protein [Mucilaginibacter sp.]
MIKVYIDWSVMSQMKQGKFPELERAISNKKQFMLYYSTSHITDVLASYDESVRQSELIASDLTYIGEITSESCAYNSDGNIQIRGYNPKALFEQQLDFTQLMDSQTLSNIIANQAVHDSLNQTLLDDYLTQPMPQVVIQAFQNVKSREAMQQLYPTLNEHSTLGDLLNAGWQQVKNFMNTDAYKTLRNNVQHPLGIKPNQLYENKDPFKEIKRRYSKLEKETDFKLQVHMMPIHIAPQWFQDISNDYMILDMHGFQEDNIRVSHKSKSTMRNTLDDGYHAAFASMGDIYITNDTRSLRKVREVYKKLNINTMVYSPSEFIEYYSDYLYYKDIRQHLHLWQEILESDDYLLTEEEQSVSQTYLLKHFLFDYFNKVYVIHWTETQAITIMLSKDKPTNNRTINTLEVANLINKLNNTFGAQANSLSACDISFEAWNDIAWQQNQGRYTLTFRNGYLQLYFDLILF